MSLVVPNMAIFLFLELYFLPPQLSLLIPDPFIYGSLINFLLGFGKILSF